MRNRFLSTITALVLAVGLMLGLSVGSASAASGTISITFQDWRCSQGGKVTAINGATVNPSGSTVYGVAGNRANFSVWFNTHNDVTATISCTRYTWYGWPVVYYINIYGQGFWPYYNGQNFKL
jgi:hypothetical protein